MTKKGRESERRIKFGVFGKLSSITTDFDRDSLNRPKMHLSIE